MAALRCACVCRLGGLEARVEAGYGVLGMLNFVANPLQSVSQNEAVECHKRDQINLSEVDQFGLDLAR